MKHFLYRILSVAALFILIPIVFTFLIQGSGEDSVEDLQFKPKTEAAEVEFKEDILTGILANEISMETETEAMKAQAVIARTNCLRALERGEDLPEGLTKGEMIRIWGQDNFSEYYSQLENAVEATKGIAMVYHEPDTETLADMSAQSPAVDGTGISPEQPVSETGEGYIRADFHKCSAGYTRDAEEIYEKESYPYLKSADSRMDLLAEDFLKVVFYTKEQFVEKGGDLFSEETKSRVSELTAGELLSRISVTKQDSAGYVTELEIDGVSHSGEEVRLVYDWNSSAFFLKEVDGEIRVVTKGLGHGLGVSLYGANELAKSGYSFEDILNYFYTGIEFVTQSD